jgi:hypothetical protein
MRLDAEFVIRNFLCLVVQVVCTSKVKRNSELLKRTTADAAVR